MTSRISFLKLMQEDFKRRSWMAAFLAVIFFLTYPVAMMLTLDNMMSTGSGIVYDMEEIKRWAARFLGVGNYLHYFVIVGTAAMLALTEFTYLHSREKLDLYHSIPLRRKKLFLSGYLTGFSVFLVIFFVCQILCVLVALAKGVLTVSVVHALVKGIVLRLLGFLFIYNAAIFSMLFTGNTVLAMFGMLVIAGYGPMLCLIVNAYLDIGFYTAVNMDALNMGYTSPLGILICLENGIFSGTPYLVPAVLTVTGIAVFMAADLWMCENRQTEHAGMALAFPKIEQILKFLLVLPASLVVGLAAYGMTGPEKKYWMFGGFLFGVFVFSALMEFIYHKDIKMVLQHKMGLVITAGTGILLISCVIFDWVGYNSWLPDRDRIEAMSVFSDSGLGSGVYQVHTKKINGGVDEYRSYLDRMMEKETTDFDSIYELAEKAAATDSRYEEGRTAIYVKYALKNGKKAYRCYWIPEENYKKLEDNLYQEEWYREICYPILANDDQNRLIRIEIGNWSGETTTISGKEAEELYKVYREELGNMTAEELRGDAEADDFNEGAEAEEQLWNQITDFYFIFSDKDGNYNQESGYPVGKSFKMTIDLLKKAL